MSRPFAPANGRIHLPIHLPIHSPLSLVLSFSLFPLSFSRVFCLIGHSRQANRQNPFFDSVCVFFACSNERLHTHRAMVTAPAVLAGTFSLSSSPSPSPSSSSERPSASSAVPRYFQSQVELAGKKRMNPENVAAIKNRFLELFIFRRPPQDERDLELCDCFNRKHFIVGTFERALALLEKHQPSDFHGPALYAYVISALGKNAPLVEQVTSGDQEHYMRIHRLAAKYNV